EPAVKPAAEHTETGVVGVLATPATFQGALFASVVERFAGGVELLKDACPGLVQRIEAGDLNGPATRRILEAALRPMLARNIDTVVLGCTHYPFVIETIQSIVGGQVRVIDPAPAVARQAGRLLDRGNLRRRAPKRGEMQFFTSADVGSMESLLPRLLGEAGPVKTVQWENEKSLRQPLPSGS
ncbi:MAG TPA: aspartate/glutamate racemase family protein, partial [Chloroflexota bacterium]